MGDTYYAATYDAAPNITLHYRRGADGAPDECVGAQIDGGPIQFHSTEEGDRHVQAIRDAADENHLRIRSAARARAESLLATRKVLGIPTSDAYARQVRDQHRDHAENQITDYKRLLDAHIAERQAKIGDPLHPDHVAAAESHVKAAIAALPPPADEAA